MQMALNSRMGKHVPQLTCSAILLSYEGCTFQHADLLGRADAAPAMTGTSASLPAGCPACLTADVPCQHSFTGLSQQSAQSLQGAAIIRGQAAMQQIQALSSMSFMPL